MSTDAPTTTTTEPYHIQRVLAMNLKLARIRLELSQAEVGQRLTPPASQSMIGNYETAKVWPKPDRLEALAAALGTTPGLLLTETPPPVVSAPVKAYTPQGPGC